MAVSTRTSDRRGLNLVWVLPTAAVALPIVLVATLNGGYGLAVRAPLGVVVWWTLAFGLTLGLFPLARVPREAVAIATCFGVVAILALASGAWGASGERALEEFNRTSLYAGLFVLVAATAPVLAGTILTGVAIAIAAVAAVSLMFRFAVGAFGDGGVIQVGASETRLSEPIGYWNGLAIFVALGIPLLLSIATSHDSRLARGAALGTIPALAAVILLASSRGGVACAVVAAVAFVIASGRRWVAAFAVAVAGLGSVAAVLALLRTELVVDGPFDASGVGRQGAAAAIALAAICVATGVTYTAAVERVGRAGPMRAAGVALVGAAVVLGLIAVAAADPVERWNEFREPPVTGQTGDGSAEAHFTSGSGNGRWQFWSSALDEFAAHPLTGGGAGSYEAWWAEHGTVAMFVRDAHSLYAETVAELGLLGGIALACALVIGLVAGVRNVRRSIGSRRELLAGALAATVAFFLGAGFEWLWELTAVSIVGIVCLAIASTGAAEPEAVRPRTVRQLGFGAAIVAAGWIAAILALVPLLADLQLRQSRDAAAQGDEKTALVKAETARRIAPWAASTHLQRALVLEQARRLDEANKAIDAAVDRDVRNWRMWLVDARIATERGRPNEGEASLRRAASLNPRSPLFARFLSTSG